jgi:tetratricopeptide (TPR) repeat protein
MTNTPSDSPHEDPGGGSLVRMRGGSRGSSKFTQIGTQVIRPLPPSGLAITYSLRADTAAFTGRKRELDLVTTAPAGTFGSGGVVAVHAIGGMPGVGKTALAVHLAHLLRDRFPDRQLFIDLHAHTPGQEPVPPEAALAGLLTEAGIDARHLPASLEARTALWRDRMAGQRALLVLDNAASSGQVAPLLPGAGGCLVLVTSRRYLGDLPGVVVPVTLDVLPPGEAQAMFLRLAPRATSEPESSVQELVRLAGYLPLAISLLARVYAKHPAWALDDLTRETRTSMLTMAAEKDSVAAALDMSYRYLPLGQKQLLRCLALHPGTTIDAYAAAALAGIALPEADGHLDALHREGLVVETAYRRYGMHDLIRGYTESRTAQDHATDHEQAREHLLDYYQYTATIAEDRLTRHARTGSALGVPASLPATIPVFPDNVQALSWARIERGNLLACLDYATRTGQHARIVSLTAAVSALLRQDGPWTDAIARHGTSVQAARHLGDRPGEANALHELGVVRRLSGNYRAAAEALGAALGIYQNLNDQLGQANALHELGAIRCYTGDYSGAAEALGAALGIYQNLNDRLGQANALNQMAVGQYLTGDYQGAVETLGEALGICRSSDQKLGQAHALRQLGVVQRQTGDYSGAAEALGAALSIYRDIDDRLGQANALNELGMVRRQTGDYRAAAEVLEVALAICGVLGYRRGQANVLIDLGAVRRQTGDYSGAAEALGAALSIYRDISDRGGEVEVLNETGALHRVHGDLDQAQGYHRQALHLAGEIGSLWDEAHALAGLGRCAQAAGRTSDALVNLRRAREIFQQIGAAEASDVSAELDAIT